MIRTDLSVKTYSTIDIGIEGTQNTRFFQLKRAIQQYKLGILSLSKMRWWDYVFIGREKASEGISTVKFQSMRDYTHIREGFFKVGFDNTLLGHMMYRHGIDYRNINSDRFVDFCNWSLPWYQWDTVEVQDLPQGQLVFDWLTMNTKSKQSYLDQWKT